MDTPKIKIANICSTWEKHKLTREVDIYSGLTYCPSDVVDNGTLVLRSSNIQNNELAFDDNVYVTPNKVNCPNVSVGDIITVVRNGSRNLLGKHAIIKNEMPNTVIGAFMSGLRCKNPSNSKFVNALLSSRKFYEEINKNLGATINQITIGTFNSMEFLFPSDKEKYFLGNFFDKMDLLISGASKRIFSLKQLKLACLQSMFAQEGDSKPIVRFKGFEDEWKLYTFDDIFKKSKIKNDLTFGCDKIISVANMYYIPKTYITDSEYLKTYNIMKVGDIAFEGNKSKNFSHGRFVENTIGDGIVSHVFQVFSPKNAEHDVSYWKYAINNENVMKNILGRCTKSSTMMTDLVVKDFLAETILVPSYQEQVLIGQFFVNLDQQIVLQTQLLEKFKHIKSACLDKMFV